MGLDMSRLSLHTSSPNGHQNAYNHQNFPPQMLHYMQMPSQSSHQLAQHQNVIYTPANQNVIYTATNSNDARPNFSTMSMSNMSHYNAPTLTQTISVEKPVLSTKTILKSSSKAFTNANSSLKKSTTHVRYENEKPAVEMRVKGARKIRPVSEGTFFLVRTTKSLKYES